MENLNQPMNIKKGEEEQFNQGQPGQFIQPGKPGEQNFQIENKQKLEQRPNMPINERKILKIVVERGGLLSPADLINGIAHRDRRSVENLVVRGYIEEVPQDKQGMQGTYTLNFYRATEKGLLFFSPWYLKIWSWIKGDIRTIIISVITALVTSLIAIFINKVLQ